MSQLLRISRWLALFLSVKPAKHSGFYTIYRRDELRTKERKIEMALTRKLLKGMGLTDEQVDTIIEAHTDTVDGLKADVSKYKSDAEKLPGVQKQLDDLKAAGDGGYKEKYEKEHSDFEAYKSGVTAKESKAAKEKAVRAYFESKKITDRAERRAAIAANMDLFRKGD